jgi:hypothetical protein
MTLTNVSSVAGASGYARKSGAGESSVLPTGAFAEWSPHLEMSLWASPAARTVASVSLFALLGLWYFVRVVTRSADTDA